MLIVLLTYIGFLEVVSVDDTLTNVSILIERVPVHEIYYLK